MDKLFFFISIFYSAGAPKPSSHHLNFHSKYEIIHITFFGLLFQIIILGYVSTCVKKPLIPLEILYDCCYCGRTPLHPSSQEKKLLNCNLQFFQKQNTNEQSYDFKLFLQSLLIRVFCFSVYFLTCSSVENPAPSLLPIQLTTLKL